MLHKENKPPSDSEESSLLHKPAASSFSVLMDAFKATIQELRAISLLRLEDSAVGVFEQDLAALQTNVRALEEKLREIKVFIGREEKAIKQVEDVIEQCSNQTLHLNHIAAHLPQHLPKQPVPLVASNQGASSRVQAAQPAVPAADGQPQDSRAEGQSHQEQQQERKLRASAPRRYISDAEYASLSTYMTNRLPISKVNTAVDDAADLCEANLRLLAAARSNSKMSTQEWKRAQSLLVNVANKDGIKGRYWMTDHDLKRSSMLKPDKTGKSILTILRHLGRISEVRMTLNGGLQAIYVLQ